MRRLALLAVAAMLLPGGAARAQQPDGVIAYTRDPDGPGGADPTIYAAAADGTGERAYATGYAPALATGSADVAFSIRGGGAAQLMTGTLDGPVRQVTAFPDQEADYGPGRFGVYGAVWSPGRTHLALRLTEGSTTTLAVVRPDGSGYRRFEFGHLFGSVIAWRDDTALAVGTDTGLKLVTVSGDVSDVPGADRADTPAAWLDAGRLVVNGTAGAAYLDSGKRVPLVDGTAWGRTPDGDVLYTDGAEVGAVDLATREPRRIAPLPEGVQVLAVVAGRGPVLVELADATTGAATIHAAASGALRRIAEGSGVTLSDAAALDRVVPPAEQLAPTPVATTGSPPTPARTAAAPVPPPGDERVRSVFTEAVPAADEVGTGPASLLVSALLTVLLMLLITFPAELFNSTLDEHYDEVRGWFGLGPARDPAERTRAQRAGLFAVYTAVAGVLYGLLDPGFGADAASARLYAGLVAGMLVVTAVVNAAPLAYARRRYRERGLLKVLPGTLLVAAACVAVSRLAGFEPGYIYGILGGFAFSRAFSRAEEGRNALAGALGALAASVVAWVAWQPVNDAAAGGDVPLLLGIADSTLATIAVGGLEGLVIGLLPLRSLQGYALARWSRPVWAVVFGVALFLFVHVLLRGGEDPATAPFATWLALFCGFGALSVSFWAYFHLRRRPAP